MHIKYPSTKAYWAWANAKSENHLTFVEALKEYIKRKNLMTGTGYVSSTSVKDAVKLTLTKSGARQLHRPEMSFVELKDWEDQYNNGNPADPDKVKVVEEVITTEDGVKSKQKGVWVRTGLKGHHKLVEFDEERHEEQRTLDTGDENIEGQLEGKLELLREKQRERRKEISSKALDFQEYAKVGLAFLGVTGQPAQESKGEAATAAAKPAEAVGSGSESDDGAKTSDDSGDETMGALAVDEKGTITPQAKSRASSTPQVSKGSKTSGPTQSSQTGCPKSSPASGSTGGVSKKLSTKKAANKTTDGAKSGGQGKKDKNEESAEEPLILHLDGRSQRLKDSLNTDMSSLKAEIARTVIFDDDFIRPSNKKYKTDITEPRRKILANLATKAKNIKFKIERSPAQRQFQDELNAIDDVCNELRLAGEVNKICQQVNPTAEFVEKTLSAALMIKTWRCCQGCLADCVWVSKVPVRFTSIRYDDI
jgi:hypothetical protein